MNDETEFTPKFKVDTPYTEDEIFALAGGMLVKPFADSDTVSVTDTEDYSQYDFYEKDGRYFLYMIDGERIEQ